jgi:hypothetical protein
MRRLYERMTLWEKNFLLFKYPNFRIKRPTNKSTKKMQLYLFTQCDASHRSRISGNPISFGN